MNTTPNENNENLELENVATAEAEELVEEIIEETATEVAQEEIVEEAATEAEEAEEIAEEAVEMIADADDAEAPTEAAETAAVVLEDEEEPKKKSKAFAFTGLIALVAVCAFLWVMYSGIFAPKYAPTYDNSENTAFYIVGDTIKGRKDNGAIYTAVTNTSIESEASAQYSTADLLEGTSLRSPNGEALFHYQNFDLTTFGGDLYVSYKDKAPDLLDTGVSTGLLTSSDGKVAVYSKMEQADASINISYYLHRKGKAPVMLAENASLSIAPALSLTAQYVAYAIDNAETQKTELYVVKTTDKTPKPVKVADSITTLYCVKDNGYVFYADASVAEDGTSQTNTIYYASKKGAVKIADNAVMKESYIGQQTNNYAYIISNEDGTADFYLGKIGQEAKKIYSGTNLMLNPDVENKNFIFLTPQDEDANMLNIQNMYGSKLVNTAEGASRIALDYVRNSRDFKKMSYLKNYAQETYTGELYYSEYKFGSVKTTLVSDTVNLAAGTLDMEYIVYMSNVNLETGAGEMYVFDGKKSKKIADNVAYFSFGADDEKVYYLTDCSEDYTSATLNVASLKNPKKKLIVDKEISMPQSGFLYAPRDDGAVYYMKNFDEAAQTGDLYYAKNNKTGTLVEAGVSKLIFE